MFLTFTFLLNAVLNFLVILVIAKILGPQEYGRYAVAFTIVTVMSTILYDWLRLSATRHYNDIVRSADPTIRASLDFAYLVIGIVIAAAGVLVAALRFDLSFSPALIFMIALASFATGQFEYWAALSRARFLNAAYARLVIWKNVSVVIFVLSAAFAAHDTVWILAAWSAGIAVAIATVVFQLHDRDARFALADRAWLLRFAKYGIPIVIANVLYQLMVLINRLVISERLGYSDAGQLSLATDMAIRLFLSIGAGIDIFLFQNAVRIEATVGIEAAKAQISKNMSYVTAILLPLAGGYLAVMPSFEALVVPPAYHGHFSQISQFLIPGVLGFCLTQFAFGPAFQIAKKTMPVIWAPCAGLLCDTILLFFIPKDAGADTYALVHTASLLLATLVCALYAFQIKECRPSLYDQAMITVCTLIMMIAIWPLRAISSPWLALPSAVVAGIVVYAVSIFTFNLLGTRHILQNMLKLAGRS